MKQLSNPGPGAWATALFMGSIAAASVCVVEPAQAYEWDDKSVTFYRTDVGSNVDVFYFDGYINKQLTDGLTSELKLALNSFVKDTAKGTTTVGFTGVVTNTMSDQVFGNGWVTGLGFSADPDLASATASGAFNGVLVGDNSYPGGLKNIDVCYTNKKTCQGSGSGSDAGGIGIGEVGTFYTTLTWNSLIDSFTLSDFLARYQGLDFKATTNADGASGIGVGTVPTPALIPSLLGLAMAARRHKKRQEAEQQEAEAVTLTA